MLLHLMLALMALGLAYGQPADRGDGTDIQSQLTKLTAKMEEQAQELTTVKDRLTVAEKELKELKDVPKVAFSASLGGNGMVKSGTYKELIYKDVFTNVGEAYNESTGVFTAPVKGVYYVRFTANGPTDGTIAAVLYKGYDILLIVHESPSGEGSDTASNGGTFLLEKGDQLQMKLWPNTQIWDNSNRHSTFTAFLLFPM